MRGRGDVGTRGRGLWNLFEKRFHTSKNFPKKKKKKRCDASLNPLLKVLGFTNPFLKRVCAAGGIDRKDTQNGKVKDSKGR